MMKPLLTSQLVETKERLSPSDRYVIVGSGFIVAEELFVAVREQLLCADLWIQLDDEETYTARRLLGDPFWLRLSRWDRGLAGRCVSHIVAAGDVPLRKVTRPGKYPNKYLLAFRH